MAIIGYARTLMVDDDVDPQVAALRDAGARRVFVDVGVPVGRRERPEWEHALDYLRDCEDTLVVVGVNRVARSVGQLAEILTVLQGRGIGFRSLGEPVVDTTGEGGPALLELLAAVAGLERGARAEDTRLGLADGREAGRIGGRPSVITPDLREAARELRAQGATYRWHLSTQPRHCHRGGCPRDVVGGGDGGVEPVVQQGGVRTIQGPTH